MDKQTLSAETPASKAKDDTIKPSAPEDRPRSLAAKSDKNRSRRISLMEADSVYTEHSVGTQLLSAGLVFVTGLFLFIGCSQETASKPPEGGPQKVVVAQKPVTPATPKPSQVSSLEAHQKGTLGKDAQAGPLGDVNFDFDRYDLRSDAKEILKSHAAWLKANPQASVEVEGHCDERGTNEYNLALGAKRAESVKRYLVDLGIPPGRVSTISYGEELSICKEQNEACWAKNRRARFVLRAGPTT